MKILLCLCTLSQDTKRETADLQEPLLCHWNYKKLAKKKYILISIRFTSIIHHAESDWKLRLYKTDFKDTLTGDNLVITTSVGTSENIMTKENKFIKEALL
jgi:hypothetical protein